MNVGKGCEGEDQAQVWKINKFNKANLLLLWSTIMDIDKIRQE